MIIPQQEQQQIADSFLIGTVEVFPVEIADEPFIVANDDSETFLFLSAGLSPDQAKAEAEKFLGVQK